MERRAYDTDNWSKAVCFFVNYRKTIKSRFCSQIDVQFSPEDVTCNEGRNISHFQRPFATVYRRIPRLLYCCIFSLLTETNYLLLQYSNYFILWKQYINFKIKWRNDVIVLCSRYPHRANRQSNLKSQQYSAHCRQCLYMQFTSRSVCTFLMLLLVRSVSFLVLFETYCYCLVLSFIL